MAGDAAVTATGDHRRQEAGDGRRGGSTDRFADPAGRLHFGGPSQGGRQPWTTGRQIIVFARDGDDP